MSTTAENEKAIKRIDKIIKGGSLFYYIQKQLDQWLERKLKSLGLTGEGDKTATKKPRKSTKKGEKVEGQGLREEPKESVEVPSVGDGKSPRFKKVT